MTTQGDRNTLAVFVFALLAWLLAGCTTVYYPNGKVAIRSGADFSSLTSTGDTITIIGHRPSVTVRSYGSVGGTLLSGSVFLKPIP